MTLVKKIALALVPMLGMLTLPLAHADVRIDITNGSGEDCSLAFNARIDQTKWLTIGWYVFLPGEEGPVILEGVNDIHDVFIYHDCGLKPDDSDEVKRAWVRTNLKFTDYVPKEDVDGYEEVTFVRLTSSSYTIADPLVK